MGSGRYQFIVHPYLPNQTWYFDEDEGWVPCASVADVRKIPDGYRGYSIELDHVLATVSAKPWEGHCVVNAPFGLEE